MARSVIQFQKGLSLPLFQRLYGTEELCGGALEKARWPDGFRCPHCNGHEHGLVYAGGLALSVPQLRPSGHSHGRHDRAGRKTTAHDLDSDHLSNWPGLKWNFFTSAKPPLGCQLRHGLATSQQEPARYD